MAARKNIDNQEDFVEIQEILSVNRTSKVLRGGRTFSFSVAMVVGDGDGRVGVGHGKAKEIGDAKAKALQAARKNMRPIQRNGSTLLYSVDGRSGASKIKLMPAPEGTGVIAGGTMRHILVAAGVKDIRAKSIGSNNPSNVASATMKALLSIETPEEVASRRGISIDEMFGSKSVGGQNG